MWLTESLKALVAGMGTVFVILILIALVISAFQHIKHESKSEEKIETVEESVGVVEDVNDDLELVAVITAAIASSLNTTSDKLVVRSFRRMNKNTKWNAR